MAKRVTNEDIILINEIYYKTKSYAETARQTGWSAGTVSKYVDKNFTPIAEAEVKRFLITDLPEFSPSPFDGVDDFGELCIMSEEEEEEIKELWKELVI
jgi:hypothetical protein